jgi:hypothetical protein
MFCLRTGVGLDWRYIMKMFAGIDLDTLNTTNFEILRRAKAAFRLNYEQQAINASVRSKSSKSYSEAREVIKHIDNYVKLEPSSKHLNDLYIMGSQDILSLDLLVNLAVKHAPNDFNIQVCIHNDQKVLQAILQQEYLEQDEIDAIPNFESNLRQHYLDTMEKNLEVARAKLQLIKDQSDLFSNSEKLPLVLGSQIADYLDIIEHLYFYVPDAPILTAFLLRTIHNLDESVTALKLLPEPNVMKNKSTKGLIFSDATKWDTRAESNIEWFKAKVTAMFM